VQPVAPAPAPAPEPPPPPGAQFATITIKGVPEHTEVFGAQGPLGFAPGEIKLVRGSDEAQLVLRAEGFVDKVARVLPDGDKVLEVTLEKKPEAAKPVAVAKPKPTAKPTPKPVPQQGSAATTKPVDDPYARH
jgi:hypothetical protein